MRTSEERFRALVSASARMIWRTDAQGKITEPIPDWENFVGQPSGESVKNNWGEFVHPKDLPRLQTVFCRGTAGTKTFTIEFRCRRHDGVYRNLVSLAAPVLGADGRVREWIGSLNDVTEKQEAEAALRASEAYNRSMVESSPDCLKLLSLDARLNYMAPGGRRLMEIDDFCHVEGADWLTFWKGDDQVAAQRAIETARAGGTGHFQGFCPTAKGTPKWWDVAITPILGPDGKPEKLLCVSRDVTGRRQAEAVLQQTHQELKASQERYQLVERAVDDGLWDWNLLTQEDYLSPRWKAMLGYGEDELPNTESSFFGLVHPDDQESVREAVRRHLEENERYSIELRLRHKDGNYRWVLSRGEAMRDAAGRPVRMVGAITEITEHKRAEDEIRSLNAGLEEIVAQRTAEVRQQEQMNRLLLENLAEGVVACDAEGRLTLFNRAAREWHGTDPRAIPPEEWSSHYNLCERDGFTPLVTEKIPLLRAFQGEPLRNAEMSIVRKDAPPRFVLASAAPLFDADGKKCGAVAVMHDISERRQAEEDIRALNASLEKRVAERTAQLETAVAEQRRSGTAIEAMQDAVFMFAADTLRFFFVNDGALRQVGYSREELLTMTPVSIEPVLTEAQFRGMIAPLLAGRKHVERFTTVHRHKDGRDVPVEINLQVVGEGEQKCFVALCRDVTERKRAEENLRERMRLAEFQAQIGRAIAEHHELQPLLQECAVVIKGTFDAAFARIWTLNEAEQMLELQASAGQYTHLDGPHGRVPVGKFKIGLMASERLPHLSNAVQGDPRVGDQEWARRQGMVAFAGYPLIADGKVVGVVAMFARHTLTDSVLDSLASVANTLALGILARQTEVALRRSDQTMRQALTELSRANAELDDASRHKDEFLANMSHELRTPLNAILGMSELLTEQLFGPLTPRQAKSVTTISTSGAHLLALINDILDLSKIEAGKMELHAEPLNVDEFCQSCLAFVRTQAMQKQISVVFEQAGSVARFTADPKRFKQILVNLLTNAVKFTPTGGRIGLTVAAPADEEVVRFTVWDSGIGIAPADQAKLFRAFTQVDSGLNRTQEGTGLGLALVAKLAELHGGSVALESELGKGSRFIVTLPVGGVGTPSAPRPDGTAHDTDFFGLSASQPSGTPPAFQRALIIEDDPTAGEQLVHHLTQLGLSSVVHARGEESVEVVLRERPDFILLDLQLPGASGWVVLTQLKEHPQTRDIPVVTVSVMDEPEKSRALGAAAHFTKPVTRDQLAALLQRPLSPKAEPTAPPAPMATASGPTILLAEDNEANIETLGSYLKAKSYDMHFAMNGLMAVKLARELHPALILMDIQMPVMDGLTAMRELRADAAFKDVPIIALTALAMAGDRERCIAAGATDYMSKPVKLKELAALVEKLVGKPAEGGGK